MNTDDLYRRLQMEINKMPVAYNETASGTEIKLLKHLFTPQEAEIAINLNIMPETLDRIHKRIQKNGIIITGKELEDVLDNLVLKGAISGGRLFESKGKGKQYSLAQLVIGMFEYQADRLTPDFVEDFERYVKDQFHNDIFRTKTMQMRTIPISQSVTPDLHVEPYDDIKGYVRGLKDDIAVVKCVCRQATEVTGGACRHSDIRETCLMFGDPARFYIGKGGGRPITNTETLAILDRAEEAGFILQPQNAREPKFVCCCCVDCCHALKILKMHPRPAHLYISSYYVTIDPSRCTGCTTCVDRCGMGAIAIEDDIAVVDHDRCLGCGVCVTVCVNNAHHLHKKDKPYVPPKTHDDIYRKIMIERFGFAKTLKTMSRVLTGRKA